jgi:hypothetical protein
MKPEFDKIQLNRQVLLIMKEKTGSLVNFNSELSGTILTVNKIDQEEESEFNDSGTIIQGQKTKQVWVLRDDIGEVFLVPYNEIESVQYI